MYTDNKVFIAYQKVFPEDDNLVVKLRQFESRNLFQSKNILPTLALPGKLWAEFLPKDRYLHNRSTLLDQYFNAPKRRVAI